MAGGSNLHDLTHGTQKERKKKKKTKKKEEEKNIESCLFLFFDYVFSKYLANLLCGFSSALLIFVGFFL